MVAVTTDTPGVLAAIDGALEDSTTSSDAMRWNPDAGRIICDGGGAIWPERWSVLRHSTYYYNVIVIPEVTSLMRGFQRMAATLQPLFAAHDYHAASNPSAHIRCATCNPCANSGPALHVKPSLRAKRRRHR
jgi:hypothetical protein